jgi:hypothetical protein
MCREGPSVKVTCAFASRWPRKPVIALASLVFLAVAAVAVDAQQILVVNPALPTSADEVRIFLSVYGCAFSVKTSVQGNTINLLPDTSLPCPPLAPPNPGLVTSVNLGVLGPGSYTLNVVINGATTDSRALFVQQPADQLSLLDGRFAVSATFIFPNGESGMTARAVQLGDASGYFWFFDNSQVDLTVKMLNGFLVNRRYWVFVSSATNVAYALTIIDTWLCSPPSPGCPMRTYQGIAGQNQNIIDITSFPYDYDFGGPGGANCPGP